MGRYTVRALKVLTALAWGALLLEGFFLDVLNGKGFAVLCVVSALAPVLALIQGHAEQVRHAMIQATRIQCERMEQATKAHTARMEEATKAHTERMEHALRRLAQFLAEGQILVGKLTALWNHAETGVAHDSKVWAESPTDTGPFPIYGNGSMS